MAPKRVLYVEDNRIFALEMKYTLEAMGYVLCASVATGEEAIEALNEQSPDIVIMDIQLGGKMDGVDAAKLIRKANSAIPIVFLSGFIEKTVQAELAQTAPHYLLEKPVDEKKLKNVLLEASS